MKKYLFTALTAGWMILIFLFSAAPAKESSQVSQSVGSRIGTIFVKGYSEWTQEEQEAFAERIDYPVRKCAHATEYAILGVLLTLTAESYGAKGRRRVWLPAAAGILYAAGDEFHQLFVPGRSGRVSDVMIDSAGVAAGLLFMWILYRIRQRRTGKDSV